MKYSILVALTFFYITACNNHRRTMRTEKIEDNNKTLKIEDDGKTMSIKVNTKNTDNAVDFSASFDVSNMNEKQKKELKNHVLDSLGVKE